MKYSKKTEPDQRSGGAFTLAELLVSMTVLSILLLMLTQLLSQVQQTWSYSEARISQFREARVAFDIMSKNLSQATLHTYLDYERNRSTNRVTGYKRQSELHFITGPSKDLGLTGANHPGHAIFFQAPLGRSDRYENLGNLFNARGYYVEYGDDLLLKPSFIQSAPKYRFRLMEYLPPAELNQVYSDGNEEREIDGDPVYDKWFKYELAKYSHPLAENVVGLIISPREALVDPNDPEKGFRQIAPNYSFDSNNTAPKYEQQVPPLVKLTLIAIDETSAVRLEDTSGSAANAPDMGLSKGFSLVRDYDKNIRDLKKELGDQKINFKIFSTTVALRSAKWSTEVPAGGTGGSGSAGP